MWRARFLLLTVIVVISVTEYLLYGYLANAKEGSRLLLYFFLNTIAAITLVPSAILLLLSTLFKIQVANDETLRYDPKNLFWALMRKLWGDTWGDPISLCKAFWLTAFSIFLVIFAMLAVAAAVLIAYDPPEMNTEFWKNVAYVLGMFFGSALLLVFGIRLISKLKTKRKKIFGVGVLFLCFTGALIFLKMYKDNISFGDAFFEYLNGIYGIGESLALIALGLIGYYLVMNFVLPRLKNTMFSHFLFSIKEKMCPLLFTEYPNKS